MAPGLRRSRDLPFDVARQTNGRILKVLMNADLDEAVKILATSSAGVERADRAGSIGAQ